MNFIGKNLLRKTIGLFLSDFVLELGTEKFLVFILEQKNFEKNFGTADFESDILVQRF